PQAPRQVAAGHVEKLRADQGVDELLCLVDGCVHEGARDAGREVRGPKEPEAAEGLPLAMIELLVAEGEARPDLQIADGELVQPPPLVAKAPAEPGQPAMGPSPQPGAADADR